MKKILILGDSFCYTNNYEQHWANKLAQHYEVKNCSSLGIGEYKIYKQYNGQSYDIALVHHTSPFRVHARINPLHQGKWKNSDFILSDVEFHAKKGNDTAKNILSYLENYIDYDQQVDIWNILVKKMFKMKNTIHFTFFEEIENTVKIPNNFFDIFVKYRDKESSSHLSAEGHQIVYQRLKVLLDEFPKSC